MARRQRNDDEENDDEEPTKKTSASHGLIPYCTNRKQRDYTSASAYDDYVQRQGRSYKSYICIIRD